MAEICIDIKKAIESSQEIVSVAEKIRKLKDELDYVKASGTSSCQGSQKVNQAMVKISEKILNEAVKMNTLGDALQVIACKYQATEKTILNNQVGLHNSNASTETTEPGKDKRNWWQKFWDWITSKAPDEYSATTSEQEKAADDAMKQELWNVLQDEKYSPENWDKASVEERKQILQDYMDEVVKIYGLQDVKPRIIWDPDATYKESSITWGYYTHSRHTVTLNEQALSDSVASWDSYELLETVSHELRHAYQHEAVDHPTDYMVSKDTIDKWDDNFDNYISSDTDYDGYRNQPVEVDARDFQVGRDDAI